MPIPVMKIDRKLPKPQSCQYSRLLLILDDDIRRERLMLAKVYLENQMKKNLCSHNADKVRVSCDSNSSPDSDIALIRNRVRRLSSDESIQFSDNELSNNIGSFLEEGNWPETDNVPKIRKFAEVPVINATVLRRLVENSIPLCVLEEILAEDF
uniref:Uncharacterized protein n=1 Tax=Glossina palpalis gambiensis TaxID=67801 RepID=A0A1B0ANE2_9MUSC